MQQRLLSIVLLVLLVSPPQVRAESKCPTQGVTMGEALLHASDTLMDAYYNTTTGLFATTGWWNSASVLYGLSVAARLHPSVNATRVLSLLSNTYSVNHARFNDGDASAVSWWGLCWVAASDLAYYLHQPELGASFLELALGLGNAAGVIVDTSYCVLVPSANGKNPELFFSMAYGSLAGQLVLRTGNADQARMLRYMENSLYNLKSSLRAFVNASNYCSTTFGPLWTSNEGLFLSVLADQQLLLGSLQNLLLAAARSGDSVSDFSRNGILVESCEPDCNSNETQYKGIYLRSVLYVWTVLRNWRRSVSEDHPSVEFVNATLSTIRTFVIKNAESVLRRNCERLPIDLPGGSSGEGWFFGQAWSGPFDTKSIGSQSSAFEVLVAAAIIDE